MDQSGLPAGGQVFLQDPPQPPQQALLRKHMRGLSEFHQMPNWSFRLSNNVVIHGFFFSECGHTSDGHSGFCEEQNRTPFIHPWLTKT